MNVLLNHLSIHLKIVTSFIFLPPHSMAKPNSQSLSFTLADYISLASLQIFSVVPDSLEGSPIAENS